MWRTWSFDSIFMVLQNDLQLLKEATRFQDLVAPVKDQIETIEQELRFLYDFFSYIREFYKHEFYDIWGKIGDVACNAHEAIVEGHGDRVSDFLEGLKVIKPDVTELCFKILQPLPSNSSYACTLELFVDCLRTHLDRLDEKETLSQKLGGLQMFLQYVAGRCPRNDNLKDLLTSIEAVSKEAAARCYLFWSNEIDSSKAAEIYLDISDLLEMLNPIRPEVGVVYGKVLKLMNSLTLSPPGICLLNKFIDNVLRVDLEELLKRKAHLIDPVMDQFQALLEELRSLKEFSIHWQTEHKKKIRDPLKTRLEKNLLEVGCIIYLFDVNTLDENTAKEKNLAISDLVEKLRLISAEVTGGILSYLLKIMKELLCREDKADLIVPVKEQLEALEGDLSFVIPFLSDTQKLCTNHEKFKDISTCIDVVAAKAERVINSFYVNKMDESMVSRRNLEIFGLIENMKLIKADVEQICLEVSKTSMTDGQLVGHVDFLLDNMKELLNCKPELVADCRDQIKTVQGELIFLRSFLRDVAEQHTRPQDLIDLTIRIKDAADEVEYIIDSFLVAEFPLSNFSFSLSNVIEVIKLIKAEVIEIYDKKKMYDIGVLQKGGKTINIGSTLQPTSPIPEDVVVGFEEETTRIKHRLTSELPVALEIISIIGMGGLGKTTLVNKVYNDPLIVDHFYIRVWCCVSQVYQKRDLLLDILGSIIKLTDQMHKMSDESLADKLRKNLKEKRYLIVMDDMWNIEALEDLQRCFPDDKNRSRIVVTTRLENVARLDKDPLFLPFLTSDESWDLLQKKVFPNEGCAEELEKLGKDIANKCQGLPLSVVLIAGVLSKIEKTHDCWKRVAESLSSHILEGSKKCIETLELSYSHLPDLLKPCFLYCAVFPEDREIPTWKLILLWIAEGFIKKIENKNLEDSAEKYLIDLIGRSLLQVFRRRSDGRIKSCRIHDLLRDFSLTKAKEENFLWLIPQYSYSNPLIYMQHRLGIYPDWKHFAESRHLRPRVRSLLFFSSENGVRNRQARLPYDTSFIFQTFKLLRVLDLESVAIYGSLPHGVELLAHLRFLAVRGEISFIHPSMANLWKLETLIVKSWKQVELPNNFSNLVKLRHLHIVDCAVFSSHCSTPLTCLQTLSMLYFHEHSMRYVISNCPNLRKMGCKISNSQINWAAVLIPELDLLTCLESLKLIYCSQVVAPYFAFKIPENLKKLTLSNFHWRWENISTIGSLPHLEVLKLLSKAFEGQRWDMSDVEFPKLRFLKLEDLDLEEWNVSNSHLPSLERLVLKNCRKLKEIPSCLIDISKLHTIEVNWCSQSAVDSAKQIQEDELDMGNDGINILIYPPNWKHERSH